MLDALQVSATASVGIAYGSTGAGSDEMLRNADLAMYTAKAGGKNCARVFAHEMHLAAVERLDLEAHLRGAAERGELVVHYQPIYELRSRVASPRSKRSFAGSTPSAVRSARSSFIPFAEETGLIDEIGQHVLVTACEEAGAWVDARRDRGRAGDQRERRAAPAARRRAPRPRRVAARPLRARARPPDPRDHRRRAHEGPGRGERRARSA